MRPGNQNNKRMRGRSRKGPSPLSRSYESNGPDVKIRGTALHVAEKYQQLARDAQVSGDRIMSENYFQHAEHYLRIVAAAQAQQPAASQHVNDDDDEGDGEEEVAAPVQNEQRRQRPDRPERHERAGRQDRPERAGRQDRPERAERSDRADRHERPNRQDRPNRPERVERSPRVEPVEQQEDYVGENSPQPFIDHMPVIDAAGQVKGRSDQLVEETPDDTKPRRRVRIPRARPAKSVVVESNAETPAEAIDKAEVASPFVAAPVVSEAAPAEAVVTEAVVSGGEEAVKPKPKPKRAPRVRKVKPAEDAPEVTPAGE